MTNPAMDSAINPAMDSAINSAIDTTRAALVLIDLQNDFLHPEGAYGRAGQTSSDIASLPKRLVPVVEAARRSGVPVVSTHFTLVPGRGGEPIIAEHLRAIRPFLGSGDFVAGSWGHRLVDALGVPDASVDKIAYSAFAHTRLEWLLHKFRVNHLIVAGIVTNGGVAATVLDAHVREFHVTLLSDGCAAFHPDVHQATLTSLSSAVTMATCSEITAQLDTQAEFTRVR